MFLWSARRLLDRARADLAAARRLARELGHPMPERRATYNLAEDLHWSGDDPDRALALARRSRALAMRHVRAPAAEDALLLARILVTQDQPDETRELLRWIGAHVPRASRSDSVRILTRAIALRLAEAPPKAWHRLWSDARAALAGDEALEVAFLSGLPDIRGEARVLVAQFPIWQQRFYGKNGPAFSGTSNDR
jgi:hypothetical protein